jgi:hypothetical protein
MPGTKIRFILNLLGRITPMSVAFLLAVFSADNTSKGVGFALAIAFLVVSEYYGVYRPLQNIDEIRRKQFDFYFGPFVESANFNGMSAIIRVNIMMARRHWLQLHLFQYYQFGMAGHPDANFHCSVKKGLCGHAFRNKKHEVVYRDFRNDTPESLKRKFRWGDKELEVCGHVKSVATIPIYREIKTFLGHVKFDYFGTLNVDSLDDAGAELLADAEIQQQIKAFAQFVQITLG